MPTNPKIAIIATPTILGVIVLNAFNAIKAKPAKTVVRVAANNPKAILPVILPIKFKAKVIPTANNPRAAAPIKALTAIGVINEVITIEAEVRVTNKTIALIAFVFFCILFKSNLSEAKSKNIANSFTKDFAAIAPNLPNTANGVIIAKVLQVINVFTAISLIFSIDLAKLLIFDNFISSRVSIKG